MGDMREHFDALREHRKEQRRLLGVPCPRCAEVRPKAQASILMPGQKCKVDGYIDTRQQGVSFGDPLHPFHQTTETARKAGKVGRKASPWNRSAMCTGRKAQQTFEANKGKEQK